MSNSVDAADSTERPKETRKEVLSNAMDALFADSAAELGFSEEPEIEEQVINDEVEEEIAELDLEDEQEEDAEDEEVDDSEEEEEAEEETEDALPDTEVVVADGKKITIDFKNRDKIKRAFQMLAAQRRYQHERDEANAQLKELRESSAKQSETMDLLNSHIDNPEEMYRLLTGGKKLRDQFEEWRKEEDNYALMSPEEKKAYTDTKASEARKKELDKREAALNRKTEESAAQETKAQQTHQTSLVQTAFNEHRFNEVTDADEALKLDRRLWSDVKSRLLEYETVNKEIVDSVTKECAEELRGLLGKYNRKAEKAQAIKKKTKAKKAAAKAVTKTAAEQVVDKPLTAMSFMDVFGN